MTVMQVIGFLFRALFETFVPFMLFVYLFRKHGGRNICAVFWFQKKEKFYREVSEI